jgi:aminoglycoside phosphotransferase (APT) family kinase protein
MGEARVDELRRIGSGREAEIFAWGEGRVLRLARRPELREAVERERVALEAAKRRGVPVPAVYEQLDVEGRPGLVLERLDGHDLLEGLLLRPWELLLVPRVLADAHASLHEIAAPAELPDLRSDLVTRLSSQLVPPDVRGAAMRALGQLPDGAQLFHGDFHPGNVLRRHGGYAVIDWKNAARGDPAADIARTRLLMMGAWIPGWGPHLLQLPLAPIRWVLYVAYRLLYRRRRRVGRRAVGAWVPVLAAARLSEDISQERRRLLAIARRRLSGPLARFYSRPASATK